MNHHRKTLRPALAWLIVPFCIVLGASAGLSLAQEKAPVPPGASRESAARVLEALITARGPEAAAAEYRKTVAGNTRSVVDESEFTNLGERYWLAGRMREAIIALEIAAEALPEAWNIWNSLGMAYVLASYRPEFADVAGELRQKAEASYAKSIALNPRNDKARAMLVALRGARLNVENETKATLRFAPGAKTGLTGPYLGQREPGSTPELFAPGIVSAAGHGDFAITFTPDGKELYFTRRKGEGRNAIMISRLEKDGWTAPEEAAFSKGPEGSWAFEPHITPDGRKLYFGGERALPGATKAQHGLWVVERTAGGGWSEPAYFGPGMYVSVARNGDLYMTDDGCVVRRWTGAEYAPPEKVPGAVNSPAKAAHSFIAPDGSFILFDSTRPGGQSGGGDLYVCFRKPDGSWSEAMNLGDAVNTPASTMAPSVSPDGKYIFYTSCRDIYWVSAAILESLRAKALR